MSHPSIDPGLITTIPESNNNTDAEEQNQISQSLNLSEDGAVKDYLLTPRDDLDRPAWYASSDVYTFLATSEETDFAFNAFDFFAPVGGGPPTHFHGNESEAFYVVEGEFNFFIGNESEVEDVPEDVRQEYILESLPVGSFVYGPRYRPHGFRNINSQVSESGSTLGARMLSITAPGGLDLLFEYAGNRVLDRNNEPPVATREGLIRQIEFAGRTNGGLPFPGYEPPSDALDYVIVFPDDTPQELIDLSSELNKIEGFSVWSIGERPKFTGPFDIEYTSLVTLEESANELAYNQFSLASQDTETFAYADLSGSQVTNAVETSASGTATLQLNEAGEVEYSLTVSGLDFGELTEAGIPLTPDNQLDDLTGIHLHSGTREEDGSHVFDIFSLEGQDETDFDITLNDDGSTTIEGVWEETERKIPSELTDLISSNNLPGTESDFYFQIHTEGNQEGEIRGQVALNTNDFPEPVKSENHQALYVKDGQLSLKIGNEVRLVEPETFVYIPPGQEYSLGNFGEDTVDSLAVTVVSEPELNSTYADDRELSSPLSAQGDLSTIKSVFLGDEADFFDNVNDDSRQVYGGDGNDELYANYNDRLFGENGDDLLNAVTSNDNNRLDGGDGNDELLAGKNGVLIGGDGNDLLRIVDGDNNFLSGGAGEDRFWIANGRVPDTVSETRQSTELGLPPLSDTRNTIVDFEAGVDKIGIGGMVGISSFDDLKFLPTFDDIQSTSILVEIEGIEGEISLANVVGVQFNQFSSDDFVFI